MPLAATVKVALLPTHTAVDDGAVVTADAVFTVKIAAEDVADVQPVLLATSLYWYPLVLTAGAVSVSVVEVCPARLLQPLPLFTCH